MSTRPVSAIVLAAGEGTRMRSQRPKPLHLLCGRPMIMHVLEALTDLTVTRTVVVTGHGAERVTKKVQDQSPDALNVAFVEQPVQRGTGDAAIVGLTAFPDDDVDDTSTVVVLPGDHPLLRPETISGLVRAHEAAGNAATVLSARLEDPTGYGRIIRGKDGRVTGIVEQRDASNAELEIDEINTSIYCFRRDLLGPALRHISPDNAQAEYYLTDVISVLAAMGHQIGCVVADDASETRGVNDRWQLALCERELRTRTNRRWLLNGVTMVDPAQTYIEVTVELGRDVTLFPGTVLQGRTVIGEGSDIGPNTRVVDSVIGGWATVESSVVRDAEVGDGAVVGPFAFLPPGTSVPPGDRTGPFYTGGPD
jgi:bifunctional UDP-N-acetylglucosamine pyrophosphorylase/glucosamine-1-phosphate N-acetyltransferase